MTGFEVDPEKTLPEPLHGSVVLRENSWISLESKTLPFKNHRFKNKQTNKPQLKWLIARFSPWLQI